MAKTRFNDSHIPLELWVAISDAANHVALPGLALTNSVFFEAIGSENAWRRRAINVFSRSPKLMPNEKFIDYYLQHYMRLEMHKLNARDMGENTKENNDFKLNLLKICINEELERLADRLIQSIPQDYLTNTVYRALFNNPLLCLNNNINIANLLLDTLQRTPNTVTQEMVAAACLSVFPIAMDDGPQHAHRLTCFFNNVNPDVLAIFWKKLPTETQTSFCKKEYSDLKLSNRALLPIEQLGFTIYTFYKFFSNIHFIFDALPTEKRSSTFISVLYYYLSTPHLIQDIPTVAKSIPFLLDELSPEDRLSVVNTMTECARALLNNQPFNFSKLPIPDELLASLRQVPSNTSYRSSFISMLCYACALIDPTYELLTEFLMSVKSLIRQVDYFCLTPNILLYFLKPHFSPKAIDLVLATLPNVRMQVCHDVLHTLTQYHFPSQFFNLFLNYLSANTQLLSEIIVRFILQNARSPKANQEKILLLKNALSSLPRSFWTNIVRNAFSPRLIATISESLTKPDIILTARTLLDSPGETLAKELFKLLHPKWNIGEVQNFMQTLDPGELEDVLGMTLSLAWNNLSTKRLNELLNVYYATCNNNKHLCSELPASFAFSFWKPFQHDKFPRLAIVKKYAFIAACKENTDYPHNHIARIMINVLEQLPESSYKYRSLPLDLLLIAMLTYFEKKQAHSFCYSLMKLSPFYSDFPSRCKQLTESYSILISKLTKIFGNQKILHSEAIKLILTDITKPRADKRKYATTSPAVIAVFMGQ